MIKVVVDTNILISGIITTGGKPAKILDLVREKKVILIISPSILEEVKKVLSYPHI